MKTKPVAKHRKKHPICAECGHRKDKHDLSGPDGYTHCNANDKKDPTDKCHCPGYKSAAQKLKEQPRKTRSKTSPTKTSDVISIISLLVGTDRKAQVRLRQMVRLLQHVDRIELSARQVVHHTHAVSEFTPRQLHQFLLGKNTEFRTALKELEKNL